MVMEAPKSKRWLDGVNYEQWPIGKHVGWAVITAGWVDLDLEAQGVMFNTGRQRKLPPGTPMILKHIDEDGYAYTYSNNGVMRMPVQVLEPWKR